MGFNLDQLAPQAFNLNGGLLTNVPYFRAHSITLADGERVVLIVQAQVRCYSAQFKLALDYMTGQQEKEVVISNRGTPFAVTGLRFGPNNVVSYKEQFFLQGDFSVTPPTPSELASENRTAYNDFCPD